MTLPRDACVTYCATVRTHRPPEAEPEKAPVAQHLSPHAVEGIPHVFFHEERWLNLAEKFEADLE